MNYPSWPLLIFIALVVALVWVIHRLQSIIKKRETAEFERKEFEKWRTEASDTVRNIQMRFNELNDLHDFDRNAFRGEDGQEAVDAIRERLVDLRREIDRMSGWARTHEQFRMVSDVTYVHSALRSAMTHYSRS